MIFRIWRTYLDTFSELTSAVGSRIYNTLQPLQNGSNKRQSGKTGTNQTGQQPTLETSHMASKKKPNPDTKLSLADLWDDTDPSDADNSLPAGADQELRLNKLEYKKSPKGEAVFAEYECIEGEHEGSKSRQMYKLRDADGSRGPGLAYLQRDLALLGYEDVSGKKLLKTLKEITEEQPMVIATVKENGQYKNVFLQGPLEGVEADDDEDEDEEDEDEDDEPKKKKKSKKAGKKKKADDDDDDDEDEEDEDEDEDEDEEDEDEDEDEDDEDEDEEEEAPKKKKGKKKPSAYEPAVGDTVKWEDADGDEFEGEVKKIKGDKLVIEDEDGDKHIVDASEVEEA